MILRSSRCFRQTLHHLVLLPPHLSKTPHRRLLSTAGGTSPPQQPEDSSQHPRRLAGPPSVDRPLRLAHLLAVTPALVAALPTSLPDPGLFSSDLALCTRPTQPNPDAPPTTLLRSRSAVFAAARAAQTLTSALAASSSLKALALRSRPATGAGAEAVEVHWRAELRPRGGGAIRMMEGRVTARVDQNGRVYELVMDRTARLGGGRIPVMREGTLPGTGNGVREVAGEESRPELAFGEGKEARRA
eukprot:CAMPEP_0174896892 /NCGR_PEP_ID=MMETSP0167-20121228/10973_1 /TAXON_ID=38298 /ORGANISM="Rhodella maculata, Strain CCMP736" /LENGTH=244 /DNA_ID=CAMNT_0016136567 /DNA_START=20 /DNA_END=754 /DNA_ORIENTATION=+